MVMIGDECGAIGAITGKEAEVLEENLFQFLFVYDKYHMT
jgi:hypothetical protein